MAYNIAIGLGLGMTYIATSAGGIEVGDALLLETGDYLLLETGDKILIDI